MKYSPLGHNDHLKSAEWFQVENRPQSIYSKNASPLSGGSGTGKLSLRTIVLIAGLRFWCTVLACCFLINQ